ncbi:hypothetical protein ORM86_22775 [Bacillus cereus]|uniref:hypothetical protein n=1 Tax=Bacillus cereus TaxID=1396 RepID=UPI002ABFE8E8|nr:hypothetical protein [Bacillus cereus]MDZ4486019.1 hypothetical protein [Bacillus cereus]
MDLEPIETEACIRTVNNKLMVEVGVETTEALEGIKEVTQAANECADALDKLEKIMDKFTNRSDTVELYCGGKLLSKSTVNHTADSIQGRIIKGEELGRSER